MAVLRSTASNPTVRAIHLIQTGSGEQHPEHRFRTQKPLWWWVLTSRSWLPCPIHAFLLEHRDGLVLFDTGLDPAIAEDPGYISQAVGRVLLKRIFRLHIRPEDRLGARLRALGFDPADVRKVVVSHLHFDHIGGIGDVPQAELLVSQGEWDRLSLPRPEHDWILREHVALRDAKWCQVHFAPSDDPLLGGFDGAYDVMGDGSMVLLPTPGHTPGSLSMLVRAEGLPPLLFVGDLTYQLDALQNDVLPGLGDAAALRQSYAKVRELMARLPGLIVLPAHDPATADVLARASRSEVEPPPAPVKERPASSQRPQPPK